MSDVDGGDFEDVGMQVGRRRNGGDRKGGEREWEKSCDGVEPALARGDRGEE